MSATEDGNVGFESVFRLVGGHGRFQWFALGIWCMRSIIMTFNHMSYTFLGAVPAHWCHIADLDGSSWTEDQIKNISIPKIHSSITGNWQYDQCHQFAMDYSRLLEESQGNFEIAYGIVHNNQNANSSQNSCESWTYDRSIYQSTIVTEFDLVCGSRYLTASIQSFYMVGALTGMAIFGPLNDRILGRRKSVLLAIILVIIGGFLTALSTSYVMFIASRFIIAIGTVGSSQAVMIWFLEHCDTKTRAKMYCLGSVFFGVGYALLPIYAYFIRTWNYLQLSFTLTALSLLSFYWIFPESARWLASQGRDDEAVQALERIARVNKMTPLPSRAELLKYVRQCHSREEREQDSEQVEMLETNKNAENGEMSPEIKPSKVSKNAIKEKFLSAIKNFAVLLSTPELRRTSIVVWIHFVTVAFVYYGFVFSSVTLTTNPYLVVFLGALMEIPAAVLPIPFLNWWGRRPTTLVSYVITGVTALGIALTPAVYQGLRTILSMTGKLFITSSFTIIYLVASEAYPTVVRTTGQGTASLMGRFGSMTAPYVADMLTTVYPDLPSVIFGIVAFFAAVAALFIPEMKDVDMKDQVEEGRKKSDVEIPRK